jgi:oleate hydratase
VHLIRDALLLGHNIHILNRHTAAGGGIKSSGNAEKGYMLYTGCLLYFHDKSVKELLSLILSDQDIEKSLLYSIRDFERDKTP